MHQIELWQQERSEQLPSQKGSRPSVHFCPSTFKMLVEDK